MTKRVFCSGKLQRAGVGGSTVRVTAEEDHFQVAILKIPAVWSGMVGNAARPALQGLHMMVCNRW